MSEKDKISAELWRVVAERNTSQGVILHVRHYTSAEAVNTYVRWVEDPNVMRGAVLSVTKYVREATK